MMHRTHSLDGGSNFAAASKLAEARVTLSTRRQDRQDAHTAIPDFKPLYHAKTTLLRWAARMSNTTSTWSQSAQGAEEHAPPGAPALHLGFLNERSQSINGVSEAL